MIAREDSILLLVDFQERLMPAIAGGAEKVAMARNLLAAARDLGVPVLATEQMPEKLGGTLAALAGDLSAQDTVAKATFSALRTTAFRDKLAALSPRRTVVLAGAEAHVCVLQTALDLAAEGIHVVLVADAIGSRIEANRAAALDRARHHGIEVVTSEMVLFEWLERADTPEFKRTLPLIK